MITLRASRSVSETSSPSHKITPRSSIYVLVSSWGLEFGFPFSAECISSKKREIKLWTHSSIFLQLKSVADEERGPAMEGTPQSAFQCCSHSQKF